MQSPQERLCVGYLPRETLGLPSTPYVGADLGVRPAIRLRRQGGHKGPPLRTALPTPHRLLFSRDLRDILSTLKERGRVSQKRS